MSAFINVLDDIYYNEFDPYAAQWLRNLITLGVIAPGVVDERSIEDVTPDDLRGYRQCHLWVTKKRNMEHAVDIGLNTQAIRAAHPETGEVFLSMSRAVKACKTSIAKISRTWSRV